MQVSRIEVFGFKSFMERLVLPLDGGITGVVGPNGCGKSNIVDAIRWVLGESKASNLRGGTLEDVIFNGTDKLRPLGLAEVTITLRASSADFFSDLISPTAEADLIASLDIPDAEAEQTAAALADAVEEKAEDAATDHEVGGDAGGQSAPQAPSDRPHLTVIPGRLLENQRNQEAMASQEQALLQPTAEEVPAESESTSPQEGEGTEAQVGEAVSAVEGEVEKKAPPTFLTRFAWLKSVTEVQVTRRLYRSGESEFFINRVPCRLKDLKDLFRATGLGARAYTIVAQGEVTRIISAKPEDRRLILEEAAGVLGIRDKIGATTRRLEETTLNITRLEDVIREINKQVNSLKTQASRARNRQSLKDQIASLEKQLFANSLSSFARRTADAEKKLEELKSQEGSALAALEKAQAEDQEVRAGLMGVDVECDALRSRVDSLKEELNRLASQRSTLNSRLSEVKALGLARGTEIKRLEERRNTLSERKVTCVGEVEVLRGEERQVKEQLASIERTGDDELKKIAGELSRLRDELRQKERVLQGIRDELISKRSSYNALRDQIMALSPVNQLKKTLGGDRFKALAEVVQGTSIFAEGLKVPAPLVKAVQAVLAERAEFLISDNPHAVARCFVERVLGDRASRGEALGVYKAGSTDLEAAQVDIPFKHLLSQIEVLDRCKIAAHDALAQVYVAETLESAISFFEANPGAQSILLVTLAGDIVTASSFFSLRSEGGIIQLKQRVETLEQEVKVLEGRHEGMQAERQELQKAIGQAEERQGQELRASQERQARARDLSNRQGNVSGRLAANERLLVQLEQDASRVVQQVHDAEAKIAEYKNEEVRLQGEVEALKPDSENQLRAELKTIQIEYDSLEQVRRQGREKLSTFAQDVDRKRTALDRLRANFSDQQLQIQKVMLESAHIKEKIQIEYGDELLQSMLANPESLQTLPDSTRNEYESEVQKIRTRIHREGDVDPSSIQRFEEENQRLEDMVKQQDDLKSAANTLQKTINRLTATSEERFIETFNAVKRNFSGLIPRLFGGGKGAIELTDPAHPLESGVEINARPPGKKLKSMELMSGGEKALCATALIFSMFLERPSPLCLLDEVDAPLDEGNLVRFLSLVKDMSARTQFIMITHNKQSMSMADRLVGVTMQEPGASKVITVSLQEAYSQVA